MLGQKQELFSEEHFNEMFAGKRVLITHDDALRFMPNFDGICKSFQSDRTGFEVTLIGGNRLAIVPHEITDKSV
ncbi:MAG: hypothetical protein PHP62_02185, partial [Candidatus Moranbacteria bacterium]|nr:hypothetical protein [Candidatus Moranbacteria bacterium]